MHKNPTGDFTDTQDIYSLGRTFMVYLQEHLASMNKECLSYGTALKNKDISKGLKAHLAQSGLSVKGVHLNNIEFENPDNDPAIEALNNLVKIMVNMTNPDQTKRDELEFVIQDLNNIQNNLKKDKKYSKDQGYRRGHSVSASSSAGRPSKRRGGRSTRSLSDRGGRRYGSNP